MKRQLHLIDIDLRWGVTEEEERGKVLEIILDEVEPFLVTCTNNMLLKKLKDISIFS